MNVLKAHPSVLAAASQTLQAHTRLRELAIQIQQIPSPTGNEAQVAQWIAEHLSRLGIQEVLTDNLHNVLARIPGQHSRSVLMVSAHTDTVFPLDTDLSYRVVEEEGLVYGASIGDNSAGVAALLYLAECLCQVTRPPVDIWLVANSGEEGLGDLRGMKAAVDRLQDRLGASIVIEGMGLGRIVHQGLGSKRYRISVKAPGGHSWSDFGSPSAIHILSQIAGEIAQWQVPGTPRTTFNIGMIDGGTSVNTVAQHASLELDLRSEDRNELKALASRTEKLVARFRTDLLREPEVEIALDVIGDRPSGQIPANHPLISAAQEALQVSGIQKSSLRISSTDSNVPLSRGIPSVCVGATEGGGAHRAEEWINSSLMPYGAHHLLLLTWWAARWLSGDVS
ncbi:MAG: M20/M25/M40 family metallo-hydrolase [Chloroflexota bacterium]